MGSAVYLAVGGASQGQELMVHSTTYVFSQPDRDIGTDRFSCAHLSSLCDGEQLCKYEGSRRLCWATYPAILLSILIKIKGKRT